MKDSLKRIAYAAAALMIAAPAASLHALVPSIPGEKEPPVDCKKNPDDPRCKEEKKKM